MAQMASPPIFDFIGLEVPMCPSGTEARLDRRSGFRRSFQEGGPAGNRKDSDCFCWMEADTPARLRPSDLQNPEDFHRRLAQWLMEQR